MFRKKYIFETESTRTRRIIVNCIYSLTLIVVLYFVSCIFFIYSADKENKKTKDFFYKKTPDLIAVFTGDSGRIAFAIETFKKFSNTKIFISGVYNTNTINTLLDYQKSKKLPVIKIETETVNKDVETIDSNMIDIDYYARNTVENVMSTIRYLRKKKEYKNVLIISNDYHIKRIRLIMDKLKDDRDPYQYYYKGIETNYKKWRNIKKLIKEVYKWIKTYSFLMLWNNEKVIAKQNI